MSIKGYVYVTSSGYDPEQGKHIKDPYLGSTPTLGACMTNIRRQVVEGDHIFVVSGKIPGIRQFVIGGFEVAEKLSAIEAFRKFPERRLSKRADGQLTGNVIVNAAGEQHRLDQHKKSSFDQRIRDYVVGRNPIVLKESMHIARGREESLDVLAEILKKPKASSAGRLLGRGGSKLEEQQVRELKDWLLHIKYSNA